MQSGKTNVEKYVNNSEYNFCISVNNVNLYNIKMGLKCDMFKSFKNKIYMMFYKS